MTPHDVLNEFQTSRTFPRAAMQAALDAKEEMLPVFLAEFDRASDNSGEKLPYGDCYGIMLEIIGEWADSRAYLPLARFFRLDEETLDWLIADGITESADHVMAAVAADDLTPIFDIVLDRKAELFMRCGMISALLRIAIIRPACRPDVTAFFEGVRARFEPDAKPYLLGRWAEAVAVLGLGHLDAEARAAIGEFREPLSPYNIKDFEEDLKKSGRDPSGSWFLRGDVRPATGSAIRIVSQWHCYSAEYIRKQEENDGNDAGAEDYLPLNEPDIAFNPYRGVGRNDPCPCGSGKKYKKCCLE